MIQGIGLGIGINRSNYAQGIFNAYQSRVTADGGVTEAGACVDAVSGLLLTASLLLIPSGYKSGKAYAQIPTNGNGDLTWTRASTALRTNSSGLLESMGSGVPRLSYMYGSCPALLLEPQRTNTMLYSQAINSWATKTELTITDNNATSPDGTTSASYIQQTTGGNAVTLNSQTVTVTTGQVQTISFYAKAKEVTSISLRLGGVTVWAGGTRPIFTCDLSNGTISVQTGSITVSSESVGNGWYRFIVVSAATIASGGASLQTPTGAVLSSTSGDGFYLWGVQWEQNASYPTTYIPTTAASATRVADSFSRNNIYTNGLITSSGGTWFVELRGNLSLTRDSSDVGLFIGNSSNGTSGDVLAIRNNGTGRLAITKRISGTQTGLYTTTTDTTKIAIKWNGTSVDVFVNGTKQVSATSFTATNMEFFNGSGGDVTKFIQQMALFSTPLSDTDCTTITTL
jgi:hypothetical protein